MRKNRCAVPPRITSLRKKLVWFSIFFLLVNALTFFYAYYAFHMGPLIDDPGAVSIDGSDFTLFFGLYASALEGALFIFSVLCTTIINAVLVLCAALIFNFIYARTVCIQRETLKGYIGCFIWGSSAAGVLLNLLLNWGSGWSGVLLVTVLIYFPLPVVVHLITWVKLNKAYDIYDQSELSLHDEGKAGMGDVWA